MRDKLVVGHGSSRPLSDEEQLDVVRKVMSTERSMYEQSIRADERAKLREALYVLKADVMYQAEHGFDKYTVGCVWAAQQIDKFIAAIFDKEQG